MRVSITEQYDLREYIDMCVYITDFKDSSFFFFFLNFIILLAIIYSSREKESEFEECECKRACVEDVLKKFCIFIIKNQVFNFIILVQI